MVGLTLFHHAAVYTDPSDPKHVRLGGFLQLWLWPATLTRSQPYASSVFLPWIEAPPRRGSRGRQEELLPESHRVAPTGAQLGPILAGGVLPLGTWALALNNYTLRICADASGLRPNSALGWRVVRWDLVKERSGENSAWPGSSTQSIAFTAADGVTLLPMST
jgi:hypothetical protein